MSFDLSSGTAIFALIAVYFVIKYAVKNGIREAYEEITGTKLPESDSLDDDDDSAEA